MRNLVMTALALTAVPVASAAPQPESMKAFTCANALLRNGEYLKAVDLLSNASAAEKDASGILHQFGSQVTPFVTGVASVTRSTPKLDPKDLSRLSQAQLRDAIPEIVRRARQTNIVILNEEHLAPRDRAFALQVARALRPLGYSILAAEGFASSPDQAERERKAKLIADDGYPRLNTGLYTKDPVFADFVRQSLSLGYRPVVYEFVAPKGSPPSADDAAQREQGEADNLVKQIFAKTPAAKVLIYVGYGHALEQPLYGNEWLAARLKRMTGIDPLTIDQTTLSPSSIDTKGGRALYAALRGRLHTGSVVPMLGGKPLTLGTMGGGVDLEVAHPPARFVRGRPDWLTIMGRKPVSVPARLIPSSGRALVQAFIQGEGDDSIPIDQVIVTAGHKPPPLMLSSRPVRFQIRTGFRPGDCEAAGVR